MIAVVLSHRFQQIFRNEDSIFIGVKDIEDLLPDFNLFFIHIIVHEVPGFEPVLTSPGFAHPGVPHA